jgi:hypothetical protein
MYYIPCVSRPDEELVVETCRFIQHLVVSAISYLTISLMNTTGMSNLIIIRCDVPVTSSFIAVSCGSLCHLKYSQPSLYPSLMTYCF